MALGGSNPSPPTKKVKEAPLGASIRFRLSLGERPLWRRHFEGKRLVREMKIPVRGLFPPHPNPLPHRGGEGKEDEAPRGPSTERG